MYHTPIIKIVKSRASFLCASSSPQALRASLVALPVNLADNTPKGGGLSKI